MRSGKVFYLCVFGLVFTGCSTNPIEPSALHMQQPANPAAAESSTPQPIKDSVILPPPQPAGKVATYSVAADQGLAEAQNNLGALYRDGHGLSRDYAQAAQWWRKAADQGSVEALTLLNNMYPYTADLTCTSNGKRFPLIICFAPTHGSGGSELEITNGEDYNMYQFMQIANAGSSMVNNDLTIPLNDSFEIKAPRSKYSTMKHRAVLQASCFIDSIISGLL